MNVFGDNTEDGVKCPVCGHLLWSHVEFVILNSVICIRSSSTEGRNHFCGCDFLADHVKVMRNECPGENI